MKCAFRKVTSTKRLNTLLQAAIQGGLGPPLSVHEEKLGKGHKKELQPPVYISPHFCVDDSYTSKGALKVVHNIQNTSEKDISRMKSLLQISKHSKICFMSTLNNDSLE